MQLKDLQPANCTVLLGIFDTPTYGHVCKLKNVNGYSQFHDWDPSNYNKDVIKAVSFACQIADMIIFILDKVHFPVNTEKSITCKELVLICGNEELFNKTVFVKGDNIIDFDKNLVLN